ncbi:MAG: dihydropteroate synthase [Bacteroidales bacterium]|nr:dihydropteroate synthase [Bacteroidales bacterium]
MVFSLKMNGQLLRLDRPRVMGIVNVTPDSFYAGSRCEQVPALMMRVGEMIAEGADILDIGACSTRPGSDSVSEKEELSRLMPALEAIRKSYPEVLLSVDTFRAEVARRAVEEFGVAMINDISGGDMDSRMFETAARCQVPYVLSHIQGRPKDMQQAPVYDDLMTDICRYLAERVQRLRALGLNDIVVDPGFGFGKTLAQNYELLRRLPDLSLLGAPLMVGLSRKSMICRLLDVQPEEALNGTTVLNALALKGGAHILRVHDVAPAVQCVKLYMAYQNIDSCFPTC